MCVSLPFLPPNKLEGAVDKLREYSFTETSDATLEIPEQDFNCQAEEPVKPATEESTINLDGGSFSETRTWTDSETDESGDKNFVFSQRDGPSQV